MTRKLTTVFAVTAALAMPALALGGTYKKPPEETQYSKTGTSNNAMTAAESDSNNVAKKISISVAIYECGNSVPFTIDDIKIKKGVYKVDGKYANLASQKYDLAVKGKFKSANKIVEKLTISKGKCTKSIKVKLKRQ